MLCLRHRRIVLAINMDPKIFASVRLVHLESRSRHIFFGSQATRRGVPAPAALERLREYLRHDASEADVAVAFAGGGAAALLRRVEDCAAAAARGPNLK